MIQETYVSFEVAKLLKEKGFNEKCFALYDPNKILIPCGIRLDNIQVGKVEGSYSAPTHQMACEWLRENYKIHVSPYPLSLGWYFEIFDIKKTDITGCNYLYGVKIPSKEMCLSSYDEATDAALKYVLENLI